MRKINTLFLSTVIFVILSIACLAFIDEISVKTPLERYLLFASFVFILLTGISFGAMTYGINEEFKIIKSKGGEK